MTHMTNQPGHHNASAASNPSSTREWDNNWQRPECHKCGKIRHWGLACRNKNLWCTNCHSRTHNTVACRKTRKSSMPHIHHEYHPKPSPRNDNHTIAPISPNYSTHPSPRSALQPVDPTIIHQIHNNTVPEWYTIIQQKKSEDQSLILAAKRKKDVMSKVASFDHSDPKGCITRATQLQQAAGCADISF